MSTILPPVLSAAALASLVREHPATRLLDVRTPGEFEAEHALRAAGMSNLHVLDGGVLAWTAAGLPVRSGSPRMSLERQVRIVAGVVIATGALLALFVSPLFAALPALVGAGLAIAGATDNCLLGLLLGRLPFNRRASCDVPTMVRALTSGASPHDTRVARATDLPRAV